MMGLEQNYWYDGRRDVAAATDAALDYLVQLNERFDGNWNMQSPLITAVEAEFLAQFVRIKSSVNLSISSH